MEYCELRRKIEELKTLPFELKEISISSNKVSAINLLRKAQLYNLQINLLDDDEKKSELRELISTILIDRFRKLAPSFSEKLLNKMLCFMNRGIVRVPLDLLIIDEMVFVKEAELSDWGELFSYEIIMFINEDYFSAFNQNDFNFPHDGTVERENYTLETYVKVFDFISCAINKALYSIYGCDLVMPVYKLNTSDSFYGYQGLTHSKDFFRKVNLYFNKQSFDIIESIIEHKPMDIKMIVQEDEDISLYTVCQSFENNEPVWKIEKSNDEVWKLSAILNTHS